MIEKLESDIEALVRSHIEAVRHCATAAVARATASSKSERPSRARAAKAVSKRRSTTEVKALSEALYEAICTSPGETMSALAPRLGSTTKAMEIPMLWLRKAGRVRSVGKRAQMRYFPMTAA